MDNWLINFPFYSICWQILHRLNGLVSAIDLRLIKMKNLNKNDKKLLAKWGTYLWFNFRTGSSYPITFPVGAVSGQTVSTLNAVPGLAIASQTQTNSATSTTVANTAPSILDFNLLRTSMIQAIDILDQKIRDIVMTTAPTCPWKICI